MARTIGYLVDVQTPEQGIWLVNADGTDLRKLVDGPLVIGRDVYGLDDALLKVCPLKGRSPGSPGRGLTVAS